MNDLIARMHEIRNGYKFISDDSDGVVFKDLNDESSTLKFNDWAEVDSFVYAYQN